MSLIEQVILAVIEETKYVPDWIRTIFPGLTFFSANDEWRYLAIMDDRTCRDCAPRDGLKYTGEYLRLEFPWLIVEGSDSISPRVHINCRCILLRESWLRESNWKTTREASAEPADTSAKSDAAPSAGK